jgi:hypothetical protein
MEKQKFALQIRQADFTDAIMGGHFRRFKFNFLLVTPSGTVQNPISTHFEDLCITGQASRDTEYVYGMRAEYRDCYSVSSQNAAWMARMLKKTDRAIEKLMCDKGYRDVSVSDFCAAICVALGVDTVVEVHHNGGWDYATARCDFYTLEGGIERINEIECNMLGVDQEEAA